MVCEKTAFDKVFIRLIAKSRHLILEPTLLNFNLVTVIMSFMAFVLLTEIVILGLDLGSGKEFFEEVV